MLTAAVATLAVAAPASPAMTKGLEDDPMVLSDDPAIRAAFWTAAREAKVKTVRLVPKWRDETAIPGEELARVRRAITEGQVHGNGARFIVGVYHGIARGKARSYRVPAKKISAYVSYTRSLAAGISDLPVAGYLTWNEPNYSTTWPQTTARAREWVTVSNRTYRAIRSADPGVPIYAGEAAPNVRSAGSRSTNPGRFFRDALCLNAKYKDASRAKSCRTTKLLADGITLHTYDFVKAPNRASKNKDEWTHGNLPHVMKQLRKLAQAKRITTKASRNVHITEFAYRTPAGPHATKLKTAASWTKVAWNLAKKQKIKSFTWYMLRDPANPDDNFTSGLQDRSGKPYPVWATFRGLK